MPVYAYQCEECGVLFERRQSFDDAPVSVCPECEGSVRRLIQPAGIIFRGSGFYVTDHKGASNSAAPGKAEGKAEGKPEAKAESKTEKATETVSASASAKSDD